MLKISKFEISNNYVSPLSIIDWNFIKNLNFSSSLKISIIETGSKLPRFKNPISYSKP